MPAFYALLLALALDDASSLTRRDAGASAAASLASLAVPARAAELPPPLAAALSAKPASLAPLASGSCAAAETPPWLAGAFTVAASRLDGVAFPRGGGKPPPTAAGARMGTILALPNVGATPRGYARVFGPRLDGAAAENAAAALPAFWPAAEGVTAVDGGGRVTVAYAAPTVSRGVQKQRIVAERLACAAGAVDGASAVVAERWAQASSVEDRGVDDDAPSPPLSGTYTAWHRYDALAGGDVRETLRVAAFDDDPAAPPGAPPLAVYDYSFLLRRPSGQPP